MSADPGEILARAQELIESTRIGDAVALLEPLKALHPENPDLWFALGRAQGLLGHEAEAEAAFSRTAALRPGMHEAHLNLALSRVYQQKLRDAIPAFVAARRLKADYPGLDTTLFDILQSILQQEPGSPADRLQIAPLGDDPLVSIIIPTQNRAILLKDALASVAGQTYRNWEVVVINDGGEDISGVIDALPREIMTRAVVLRQPAPTGQARARNRAIQASRGEIVAFLDDDDIYKPEHLETLVQGLRESGAGVAYTLTEKVNERLVDGKRVEFQRNVAFPDLHYSRALLLVRNFIPSAGWGVRRACFEQCGGFDESLTCLEDWDLLMRFSGRTDFHRIPKVTTEIHIRLGTNDSISTRIPSLATSRQLYARYPGTGHEWIDLARELYLEALFPQSP
jgi:tetratricopeptide (TPR) repeat protein